MRLLDCSLHGKATSIPQCMRNCCENCNIAVLNPPKMWEIFLYGLQLFFCWWINGVDAKSIRKIGEPVSTPLDKVYQHKLLQNIFWFSCHICKLPHERITAMWIVSVWQLVLHMFDSWYYTCLTVDTTHVWQLILHMFDSWYYTCLTVGTTYVWQLCMVKWFITHLLVVAGI